MHEGLHRVDARHLVHRCGDPFHVDCAGHLSSQSHVTVDRLDRDVPHVHVELLQHLVEMHLECPIVRRVEDARTVRSRLLALSPVLRISFDPMREAVEGSLLCSPALHELGAATAAPIRIEEVHGGGADRGACEESLHVLPLPIAGIEHASPMSSPGRKTASVSERAGYWSERVTRAIVLGAALWVGAVTMLWLFAPVVEETDSFLVTTHESLVDSEGSSVVIVLAVPVVLVALAVAAQGTRWRRAARIASGSLLLLGCLLGAMSIGLPYLPAAIALLLAGLRTPAKRTASH